MSLEGIIIGAIAILVGLAFAFVGYRFFLILLPIWGFIAGFALTANAIAGLFNEAFLATILGWIAGFFVGLLFAVLSYFFWYIAVVVLAGTVGYAIGASLLAWLGVDSGFLVFLAGLAVGAIFFVGAILLAVPKWAIIVLTALGGAEAVVVGAALAIGRFPVAGLGEGGILSAAINDSILWGLAWAVLAIAGVVFQIQTTSRFTLDTQGYRDVTYVSTTTRR